MQIENEYGSYYMDKKYMAYVKTVSSPSVLLCFLFFLMLWSKCVLNACMFLSAAVRYEDEWVLLLSLIFGYVLNSSLEISVCPNIRQKRTLGQLYFL